MVPGTASNRRLNQLKYHHILYLFAEDTRTDTRNSHRYPRQATRRYCETERAPATNRHSPDGSGSTRARRSSLNRTSIVSIRSSLRSRCTSYRASTSSLSARSGSPKACSRISGLCVSSVRRRSQPQARESPFREVVGFRHNQLREKCRPRIMQATGERWRALLDCS